MFIQGRLGKAKSLDRLHMLVIVKLVNYWEKRNLYQKRSRGDRSFSITYTFVTETSVNLRSAWPTVQWYIPPLEWYIQMPDVRDNELQHILYFYHCIAVERVMNRNVDCRNDYEWLASVTGAKWTNIIPGLSGVGLSSLGRTKPGMK